MPNKKTFELAKQIANKINEINNNSLSEDEIKEGIKEYMYLLVNEKYTILNLLQNEVKNGNKVLTELCKDVLAF